MQMGYAGLIARIGRLNLAASGVVFPVAELAGQIRGAPAPQFVFQLTRKAHRNLIMLTITTAVIGYLVGRYQDEIIECFKSLKSGDK